mgnify:CR=1 FL=1
MTSSVSKNPDPSPITACTISRDVQDFDLLIEDMEAALGEAWGDLGFAEALAFFNQPEAETLEFVAIAIDESDEDELTMLSEIITLAKAPATDQAKTRRRAASRLRRNRTAGRNSTKPSTRPHQP